jgi:hypothetical protein
MTAPTPTREDISDEMLSNLERIAQQEFDRTGVDNVGVPCQTQLTLITEIRSLRSSNAALRRALEKYGSHRGTCDVVWNEEPTDECTCGLAEALEGET